MRRAAEHADASGDGRVKPGHDGNASPPRTAAHTYRCPHVSMVGALGTRRNVSRGRNFVAICVINCDRGYGFFGCAITNPRGNKFVFPPLNLAAGGILSPPAAAFSRHGHVGATILESSPRHIGPPAERNPPSLLHRPV